MQVTGPDEWAPLLDTSFNNANATFSLRYYDTQLVSRGEEHDPNLGPWPFPDTRGPLSQAVQAFMRDGVTEIFPDWEQGPISPEVVHCTRPV